MNEAYANLALDKVLEVHRPVPLDRAFATELVYGSLRSLNTLDWILQQNIKQPLEKQTSWIRNILRLGVYQILYMDRVPPSAAVNEAANQARRFGHPGAVKFVNGVLRNILRNKEQIEFPSLKEDPAGHISIKYSHPLWLVERWLAQLGFEETVELCRANNMPAPFVIRVNTLKTTREKLIQILHEEGISAEETKYAPEGLILNRAGGIRGSKAFNQGLFQVQDESSMLAAHAVRPVPGALVVDAAAAPGGKSTHLAQLMGDKGVVIASDVHPHKLKLIEVNSRRLNITCIQTRLSDARNMPEDLEGKADFVLLDAPCTGTGVIRRRPDLRWRKKPGDLPEILKLQKEMLKGVSKCLKPGGVLVYSTCSVLSEENQEQVNDFLNAHPDFKTDNIEQFLPAVYGEKDGDYIQLYPHRHGTDGFFICRMRRRE